MLRKTKIFYALDKRLDLSYHSICGEKSH